MTNTTFGRIIKHGALNLHVHDCHTPVEVKLPSGAPRAPKTGDEWQCTTCNAVYVYTSPGTYRRGGWMFDRQPTIQLPELPDPRLKGGTPL